VLRPRLQGLLARRALQPGWELLQRLALSGLGHMNGDPRFNGEHRLLERLAARWRRAGLAAPVAIDGGAHDGAWTAALRARCPGAVIHAVEPMPAAAARFRRRHAGDRRVTLHQAALAAAPGPAALYDHAGADGSGHASLQPETFTTIYPGPRTRVPVDATTLDRLLATAGIARVHLLKLDLEGGERGALEGAAQALAAGRIEALQLERNAHALLDGLHLRRLAGLLPDHDLYRVVADGLVPLPADPPGWDARREVFKYCNLAALPRAWAGRI
jgi:FkbM family methyltransferase